MKAKLIKNKMDELLAELAELEWLAEIEFLLLEQESFHERLKREHLLGELQSFEWMLTEEQLELDWEREQMCR